MDVATAEAAPAEATQASMMYVKHTLNVVMLSCVFVCMHCCASICIDIPNVRVESCSGCLSPGMEQVFLRVHATRSSDLYSGFQDRARASCYVAQVIEKEKVEYMYMYSVLAQWLFLSELS